MTGLWVFGYGSLVSPASFGHTLGRPLRAGVDLHEAEIAGYGRRWNYGVTSMRGETAEADGSIRFWTIVALGIVASADETVNGVIGWVDEGELAALDAREQQYDRVDVTDLATVHGVAVRGPIVTYVPRPEPRALYETARDRGEAAVERRYWDLVDGAFAGLGADRRERYHATTPAPDVPIVAMRRDSVPMRHRVGGGRPDRGGLALESDDDEDGRREHRPTGG
jgi:cation transport regulator ChaC